MSLAGEGDFGGGRDAGAAALPQFQDPAAIGGGIVAALGAASLVVPSVARAGALPSSPATSAQPPRHTGSHLRKFAPAQLRQGLMPQSLLISGELTICRTGGSTLRGDLYSHYTGGGAYVLSPCAEGHR